MVGRFCLTGLFLSVFLLQAQEQDKDGCNPLADYKKMIKATATIAPGFMLNNNQTNIYVHGQLEYAHNNKLSLRSDAFWFVGAQQKPQLLQQNSLLVFGIAYHIRKKRFDCALGLQPGISLTQPTTSIYEIHPDRRGFVTIDSVVNYKTIAIPVISPYVGLTFFPGKYVNFFIEARYNNGRYFAYTNGSTLFLSEIKLSAGLGFQLPFLKSN